MGRFMARLSRLGRIGPLFHAVENEGRRQAVRFGHGVVGPGHTLVAMLTVNATLAAAHIAVLPQHAGRNQAASILQACGVDTDRLRQVIALRRGPDDPPAELLTTQLERLGPGDPFDGAETVAASARAMELFLAYRHPDTGTSHLLLALLDDEAAEGAAVLRDLGIDPATVREQLERDLRIAPSAWPSRDN